MIIESITCTYPCTRLVPLASLGLLWGLLYVRSANLLVPALVHAMWNSRIFMDALLGR